MTVATLPRLTSQGLELDTSPEGFGELRPSLDLLDDAPALRRRIEEDGYLYLPGYLIRDEVLEARAEIARRLMAEGRLDVNFPVMDAVPSQGPGMNFRADLARNNEPLERLLYRGPMMEFYARLLGGPIRHFDYTWLRAVAPGKGTPPHCDVVYMGRGTPNLYTAWTPLGDISLEMGGLMVLENSHKIDRLRENYCRKDVDTFCSNRRGDDYTGMGGGGNIASGGTLSKNPIKLRRNLGGRWLTAEFSAGDLLTFPIFMVHASLDNNSDRYRFSSDSRYQLASEPADERWIGENPIAHGPRGKRGMIC